MPKTKLSRGKWQTYQKRSIEEMKDWDFITDDPQQREPKPVGVCAVCDRIIYYDYFKGWYEGDSRALICPECIENVIEELWDEYMIDEKLEAMGMTHEFY